jgi:hypothetical protein
MEKNSAIKSPDLAKIIDERLNYLMQTLKQAAVLGFEMKESF